MLQCRNGADTVLARTKGEDHRVAVQITRQASPQPKKEDDRILSVGGLNSMTMDDLWKSQKRKDTRI